MPTTRYGGPSSSTWPKFRRRVPATYSASTEASTAGTTDSAVRRTSNIIGCGSRKAIIPVKCIDQMPSPNAAPPAHAHNAVRRAVALRTRPASWIATNAANQAIRNDRTIALRS